MSHSPNQPSRSLFIRFVSFETRPYELRCAFAKYGEVKDVYIPRDYYSRKPRGFAYVEFENLRDAENAVRDSGNIKFFGTNLEVEFAQGDRKTPNEMKGRPGGKEPDRHNNRRRRSLSIDRRPSRRFERNRSRSRSRSKSRNRWNSPRRSRSGSRGRNRRRSFSPKASRRSSIRWNDRGDEPEERGRYRRSNDMMNGVNLDRRY